MTTKLRLFAGLLGIAILSGCATRPAPRQTVSGAEPRFFGGSPGAMIETKNRLAAGDATLKPALAALVERADQALKVKPPSVTYKSKLGANGDPHDYYSQAPYLWPDPNKPDGLPYIARDGRVNPESRSGTTDQASVDVLGGTVQPLALAYYFTCNEPYAAHAARCLRVWFLDPATRMNPNMNQAQAVPGLNDGRGIGIIEAGGIVEAADAASLLMGSPHWTAQDDAGLRAWLTEFLGWLQDSKNGRAEAAMKQNHGTMYDLRVSQLALMLGRLELAKRIIEAVKEKRIAVQIEPDGRQPMELRRTKSFNYSRLNLRGLCSLATLGEWVDVDLWRFETADGRSLRKALEFMLPYVQPPPKEWPYEQIIPINRADLAGAFRQAALAYHDPRYEAVVDAFPGIERSPIQLLNPQSVVSAE